jgi:hypothetical protein
MKTVKLPFGGVVIHNMSDDAQRIIDKRAEFTLKYMKEKSWGDDVAALSIDQILEIRQQPEWKNP